jgi:2-phospho-L-lactate guanylyltransferase
MVLGMNWLGVVPLKGQADRKSRLAGCLSPEARWALSERMAAHVLACLRETPGIGRISLLSPDRIAGPGLDWIADQGTGLNAELDRVRADRPDVPLLVIFGDLPLLKSDEIVALIAAAQSAGAAIAPDRHGSGTNAIALADSRPFAFSFGPNSFDLHLEAAGPGCVIVRRPGLAFDVDMPDDLEIARRYGVDM